MLLQLALASCAPPGLNDKQIIDYILEDDRANYEQELVDYVNNTLSPKNKKMLNLTRDWLKSFLPHVLQKVPRTNQFRLK